MPFNTIIFNVTQNYYIKCQSVMFRYRIQNLISRFLIPLNYKIQGILYFCKALYTIWDFNSIYSVIEETICQAPISTILLVTISHLFQILFCNILIFFVFLNILYIFYIFYKVLSYKYSYKYFFLITIFLFQNTYYLLEYNNELNFMVVTWKLYIVFN